MSYRLPDSQHIELDALYDLAYEMADGGVIDADDLSYLFENEPESHVFCASDLDEGYDDPDEAREIVNMVGGRDLDEKIRYWRATLTRYIAA